MQLTLKRSAGSRDYQDYDLYQYRKTFWVRFSEKNMGRKKKKSLTYITLEIAEEQAREWGYTNRWIRMEVQDLYDQGLPVQTENSSFTDKELIEAIIRYVTLPPDFLEGYKVLRPSKVPEHILVTKDVPA